MQIKSTVVAYCKACEIWTGENDSGSGCPCYGCDRILRKRRGYICMVCGEIYFNKPAFINHLDNC